MERIVFTRKEGYMKQVSKQNIHQKQSMLCITCNTNPSSQKNVNCSRNSMAFSHWNADGGAGSLQRRFFTSSEVTPTVTVTLKFQRNDAT